MASSANRGTENVNALTLAADQERQRQMDEAQANVEAAQRELEVTANERDDVVRTLQESNVRVLELEGHVKKQWATIVLLVILIICVVGYISVMSCNDFPMIPEPRPGTKMSPYYPLLIESYEDKIQIQNTFLVISLCAVLLLSLTILTSSRPTQAEGPDDRNRQNWWLVHLAQPIMNIVAPHIGNIIVDIISPLRNMFQTRH